jgi:hypothetical protein
MPHAVISDSFLALYLRYFVCHMTIFTHFAHTIAVQVIIYLANKRFGLVISNFIYSAMFVF